MTDPKNDSTSRWAAAAQLAEGVTDDGYQKRRTRIILQVSALIVGSWIVGVVIALGLIPKTGSHHSGSGGPTDQQLIAQIVFVALGCVVGIGGFIWAKRTGHYITRWRAVASPLTRREKKSVRRQISGKEPVERDHLPVIVAIANQNRRATLGIAPLYFGMTLFAIATAVASNFFFIKLLELVASLLFVIAAVQLTVLYRRAGRFTDQYSDPAS